MTVLGRQGLGAKAQLVVVQTDDARYVLGVTEHGVSVVDRLPVAPAAPTDEPLAENAARSSDAEEFDRILAATGLAEAGAVHTGPVDTDLAAPTASSPKLRVRHRNDPLRGSILSPETWRQTAEAIRRAR
ncbi:MULTISPECIES: flagellar biosynthetic protein FliO [unclassified Microbacterium]|uniref:flagellar biosynthetic protein FliO n=1 Tax=unclassified Microbacterium TaxID=2609290 RepID=UPI00217E1CE5|nr:MULTISPECIES: flagellar biosynthetic protein FliO [unclassified Microbacterium]